MTIFGEEHFLDNEMCKIFNKFNTEIENTVVGTVCKTTLKIGIAVDEDKLRRWLILCHNLENIDQSDLIDIATRKKFDDKDQQIAVLEKALKLACDKISQVITDAQMQAFFEKSGTSSIPDYFIDQAEKELNYEY